MSSEPPAPPKIRGPLQKWETVSPTVSLAPPPAPPRLKAINSVIPRYRSLCSSEVNSKARTKGKPIANALRFFLSKLLINVFHLSLAKAQQTDGRPRAREEAGGGQIARPLSHDNCENCDAEARIDERTPKSWIENAVLAAEKPPCLRSLHW